MMNDSYIQIADQQPQTAKHTVGEECAGHIFIAGHVCHIISVAAERPHDRFDVAKSYTQVDIDIIVRAGGIAAVGGERGHIKVEQMSVAILHSESDQRGRIIAAAAAKSQLTALRLRGKQSFGGMAERHFVNTILLFFFQTYVIFCSQIFFNF